MPTDIEHLADEIAELAAHLDAATHRLLTLIRRFDESGAWADQGALSCAHWLSWRVGLDLGAAREHVRVARALSDLPLIADALRAGHVSYSKVRALTRVATAATEAVLLETARASTAAQLERICRSYRGALQGEQPENESERRWLRERETDTGLVRIDLQLTADEAAVVRQALTLAMSRAWSDAADVSAGAPPASLQRVDAFVAVAESYLTATSVRDTGPPVEVVVHVEADTLAGPAVPDGGTLDDGAVLSRATTDRLACDAAVVRVVEDFRGNVLAVSRRRRTIPTRLRRALRLRDGGMCRFPGCTNRRVDGHHVVAWSAGGTTTLANLCSLCRRHHTHVHAQAVRIEQHEDGGFRFRRPDGIEVRVADAPPVLGPSPADELRWQHHEAGITIDAATSLSRWDGRPVDYDHVVLCLTAQHHADRPDGGAS